MRADFFAPPQTPLELYEMLPEGTRAELIDNTIVMPPAPELDHQKTSFSLTLTIGHFIVTNELGEMYCAPTDVYLGDRKNSVQPDLFVILKENVASLTANRKRITGVPDIIIEVLSDGNKAYELEKKKDLYERFGVKEYFIVNPETGLTYHFYLGENGRYELVYEHIRKLQSRLLNHTFSW